MALDKDSLKTRIVTNLKATGFVSGEHSKFEVFAQAIAEAVVDEIQTNAEAVVSGGSSAGKHKVN